MKKKGSLVLLPCVIIISACCSLPPRSGTVITQDYSNADFMMLEANCYNVRVHKAKNHRITATMDSNLLQYVDIFARDNTLHIEKKEYNRHKFTFINYKLYNKCIIDVYAPAITEITAKGISKMELLDSFDTLGKIIVDEMAKVQNKSGIDNSNFHIQCKGMGKLLFIEVSCDVLDIELADMSNIVLHGRAGILKARLSDMAKLDSLNFNIETAVIQADDMSNAQIGVADYLNASANDMAKIHYKGSPKIININSKNIKKIK